MAHNDLRLLRGGKAAATPRGKPGEDIEDVRKKQRKRKFDSATIEMALSRQYGSASAAKKEITK